MPSPASVKPGFDRWLTYVRRANGLSQHELSLRLGNSAASDLSRS